MTEVLSLTLPFFGLVLIGYLVGRAGVVSADGLVSLEFYVVNVALPALFFQYVARTPVETLASWSFLAVTTFATYCAFAIAFSVSAMLNRGNIPEATVQGLVGSDGNIGYLAPGLALAAFGAAAAAPMALIFTFHTALVMVAVPVMMAIGGNETLSPRDVASRTARRIILQPLVLATLLGFLASATQLALPAPLDSFLTLLRQSAAPIALFTFGAALSIIPGARISATLPLLLAIKLIVHPLIVYLLLSWIGGFDPIWVYTAVLLAALPPAQRLVEVSRSYGVYAPRFGAAIVWGTAAAAVTVVLLLYLIRIGSLPTDLFR